MASDQQVVSPQDNQVLEELLQVNRSGTHQQKVLKIINSHVSIPEKIRQIKELDDRIQRIMIAEQSLDDRHIRRLIKKKAIITPSEAFDIQENLIRDNLRRPFLFFKLGDRPKLKKFQKRTSLIKVGFFPGSVKLDSRVKENLLEYQNDAHQVLSVLISILKVAWAYLNKKDYNLIVAFKKMCEELLSLPVNDLYLEAELILDETQEFERFVLMCHYKPEYPRIILSSLNMVFAKYPKMEDKLKGVRKSLQSLLNGTEYPQSIPNIIRAFNMCAYGRYLELSDLMKVGYEEIVNSYDYECPEEIQYKIRTYIDGKLNKMDSLNNTKSESQQIQNFLDQFLEKKDGNYDDRPLRMFYKDAGSEMGYNFVADSKNVSLFASNFFNLFLRNTWNLLIGEIQMEKIGKIHVFQNSVFETDFAQLKSISNTYESSFYNQHEIPYQRFIQLKKETAEGNPRELEIINMIDRMSNILLNIGKKLANIIKYKTSHSSDVQSNKQITIKEIKNRHIEIPYWNNLILGDGFFSRKAFADAVSNIVSICFLTSLYFYNQEFLVMLSREKVVTHKMKEQLESLERICRIDEYESIRNRYLPEK